MKHLFPVFMALICPLIFSTFAEAEVTPKGQYTVGIDDVLDISVLEHDKLRTMATVAADGSISFPYIGNVQVKDKTLQEIEKEISDRLADGYIKYPVVSVSLIKSRSRNFFVYGEVNRPGAYSITDNMTVLKAISVAGGLTRDGLYGKVKVRRPEKDNLGYKDVSIDIRGTTKGNSRTGDMLLRLEDIVVVEPSEKFFVYGEVVKPGQYLLEDNMTVLKAISVAGGLARDGLYGKVKVRRPEKGKLGYKDIIIDIRGTTKGNSRTGDMLLHPRDIVVVEPNEKFFVYGEVVRPGQYLLQDNMTVLRAIAVAGGFTKFGSPSRVKILRPVKEKAGYETIKVDIKGAMKGILGADILLQPGDIIVVS